MNASPSLSNIYGVFTKISLAWPSKDHWSSLEYHWVNPCHGIIFSTIVRIFTALRIVASWSPQCLFPCASKRPQGQAYVHHPEPTPLLGCGREGGCNRGTCDDLGPFQRQPGTGPRIPTVGLDWSLDVNSWVPGHWQPYKPPTALTNPLSPRSSYSNSSLL